MLVKINEMNWINPDRVSRVFLRGKCAAIICADGSVTHITAEAGETPEACAARIAGLLNGGANGQA